MAAAFFNTPEKSVVRLFHDPPGVYRGALLAHVVMLGQVLGPEVAVSGWKGIFGIKGYVRTQRLAALVSAGGV